MELDELKTAWQTMDQKLSATMALQRSNYREIRVDRTRGSLRRFMGLPIFELIVGLIAAICAGGFLVANFNHATVVGSIPAVAILLLAVITVAVSIWQLELVTSVDYSGPVVAIQRRLTKITEMRIKSAAWLMALLTPLWVVFPVFLLQLIAGYRGYRPLSDKLSEILVAPWFLANLLVCVALVGVVVFVVKRKGRSVKWSKVLAEDSLRAAAAHLAEIESFEDDK